MPANADIVAYLDQVVDLGAFADDGVADGTTIDRGAGPYFDVVLNNDASNLRDLEVSFSPHHESEAVLTDLAARMDDDPVTDQTYC